MDSLEFNKNFSPEYGKVTQISPLIRRIVAHNPSPFTFYGTGTYIIGTDEVAVIDPGPAMPSHMHAMEKALKGLKVSHILVTHNHMDHSPAAHPLKLMTGADIYAYDTSHMSLSPTAVEEGRDTDFKPDHILKDGDLIKGPDWDMDVVHTPGHLSNHLCFALRQEKALFCGDHVMGWATSVVVPPDGNMKDYLKSLEKLLHRDDEIYYPTHGNPIHEPLDFVRALIKHRHGRERQIMDCIKTGSQSIDQMIELMYSDVPTYLHPAAASSLTAHLIHMSEDGRITCEGKITRETIFSLKE